MSDVIGVLGQVDAPATTPTTLYTAPALAQTTVSSINVCNRTAHPLTFRVAIRVKGVALDNKQYLYYDKSVLEEDTFSAVLGITLRETDVVEVYASDVGLSFNMFGVETS
jgi:hypothetical protein